MSTDGIMIRRQRCGTCTWFVEKQERDDALCMHDPPDIHGERPVVDSWDYCSRWAAATEEAWERVRGPEAANTGINHADQS